MSAQPNVITFLGSFGLKPLGTLLIPGNEGPERDLYL